MPTKRKSPANGRKAAVKKTARKHAKPAAKRSSSDDYDYDIFVSYRCEEVVKPFVRDHFVPMLSKWLSLKKSGWEGRNKAPRIFLDDSDIQGGQLWKTKIMGSLPKSKIMLGLWTPRYFESKWCEAEFRHFRARHGVHLKASSKGSPLIIPVRLSDGDYFSTAAKEHQIKHDFTRFLREGLRSGTALWEEFEEAVIVLAEYLVKVIDSGLPSFSPVAVEDPDKIRIKPLPYKGGKPTI
jgi:hypothetical protein